MDSFVLLAYTSFAASRTLLQQLLACLNFILDSEDLFCWYKQKTNFYELWQLQKQRKTMDMSEASPDTYDEGYIQMNPLNESILNLHTKFTSSRDTEFKDILPCNISNHNVDHPSQHDKLKIDRKSMETETTTRSTLPSGWGSHCRTNTSVRRSK